MIARCKKTLKDQTYTFNVFYNVLEDDQSFMDEGVYKIEYDNNQSTSFPQAITYINPKDIIPPNLLNSANFDQNQPYEVNFKSLISDFW